MPPIITNARSGITWNWPLGSDDYGDALNKDFEIIARYGFHLSAQSRTLSVPPDNPADSDTYIVADTGGMGDWQGQTDNIAVYRDNAWTFFVPKEGMRAWVVADKQLYVFTNDAWEAYSPGGHESVKTQWSVISAALTTPPTSPTEGDTYIPAANATGDWSGDDNIIVSFIDGDWKDYRPQRGWIAWDEATDTLLVFDDPTWIKAVPDQDLPVIPRKEQWSIISARLTAPPNNPTNGDAYIAAANSTGDWNRGDGFIFLFEGGEWISNQPVEGWLAWNRETDTLLAFDGTSWDDAVPEPDLEDISAWAGSADAYGALSDEEKQRDTVFLAVGEGTGVTAEVDAVWTGTRVQYDALSESRKKSNDLFLIHA